MKYGIEVEGIHKGIPMIFCDASALSTPEGQSKVLTAMAVRGVDHVYVSDKDNTLDYTWLGDLFTNLVVTLDCTDIRPGVRPSNLNLMLREPTFALIGRLNQRDQIKFERDRTVYVWSMEDVMKTYPSDFAGDIEL